MELYFTDKKRIDGDKIVISDSEAAHIKRVMRHRKGDTISVTDGTGMEYEAVIDALSDGAVFCTVLSRLRRPREPFIEISIAQGLIRSSRMGLVVEKTTELGVREIIPLVTERSFAGAGKTGRFLSIAVSALKQSTGTILPLIYEPVNLESLFSGKRRYDLVLLAHEKERNRRIMDYVTKNTRRVLILIGPEGGFSDREVEFACLKGARLCSLGMRRLRSETAAIASVAAVLSAAREM